MSGDKIGTEYPKNPARQKIFNVKDDAKDLGQDRSEIFHSVVAKLLYIFKRARPDIEPTISYLITRVSTSNVDDWEKLKRVLTYLKGSINEIRIIGVRSLKEIFTWIDAAFAVHDNMRGHTGGSISMGYGIIHGRSGKHKINTKSSTESELVGLSEYLPYTIWLLMFLEVQEYKIRNSTIYQDNKSAILMERNGKNSCTANSRHIYI